MGWKKYFSLRCSFLAAVGLIIVVPIWILVKLHKVSQQQDDSFEKLSVLSGKVQKLLDGQEKLRDRLVSGVGEPDKKEELPPEPVQEPVQEPVREPLREPEPVLEAEVVSDPVPPPMPAAEPLEPVAARSCGESFRYARGQAL